VGQGGWRAAAHSYSKLSATQAERSGLIGDQLRAQQQQRLGSPVACSQRTLALDLTPKLLAAAAPVQGFPTPSPPPPPPQPQQQQQQAPQKRPIQQKAPPSSSSPSRLPSIPSPLRSPKRADPVSSSWQLTDGAAVPCVWEGDRLDLEDGLQAEEPGDSLSAASTEEGLREERGEGGKDRRTFYTLYGTEVGEVGLGARCGNAGAAYSPLQSLAARSTPMSPRAATPCRLLLQTGCRTPQVLSRGNTT
jgi:hypothetical protein